MAQDSHSHIPTGEVRSHRCTGTIHHTAPTSPTAQSRIIRGLCRVTRRDGAYNATFQHIIRRMGTVKCTTPAATAAAGEAETDTCHTAEEGT